MAVDGIDRVGDFLLGHQLARPVAEHSAEGVEDRPEEGRPEENDRVVEYAASAGPHLEQLVEELGLSDVRVVRARAEEAGRDPSLRATFDLAVARAVAPLPVLVEYALPLLRDGGVLATPKGSRAQAELAEAAGAIAALGGVAEEPVDLPLPAEAPPQSVLFVRRAGPLDERYPRRPGMPSKRPLR
ncbi:MAG: class I SAM-dependent methyltransferase [Proteobacteria bacterium]|nr:class I SAM-dependent methyltransferase [Pseudomonadota bacterium]